MRHDCSYFDIALIKIGIEMKKDKASATQSKPSPTAKERNNHEDELAFLKGKLVDLHTRLINQLDVCKEQEKQIIQLTQ